MHLTQIFLTTLAALTLAALPATASAHDGDHPFKTCAEAYDNGYAKISSGDDHYGPALDPDGDGVACDEPPAGFIPRDDTEVDGATTPVADTTPAATSDAAGSDDDLTTYVIIGVSAVVLVGGAVLVASRRRHAA
ncbi:excalibur calcium-binding domain-containing protein [Streptomyces pseudogriseolus]|uniref:excalibur calcium-binding domain-containing protein n=1 Tax=Streptomyces pseudogriseolus TaxID=36817 RepID=UPI001CE32FDB|nr:excalibur calcium-binding domain-containing protein [Streptomyces pseudogriseolus]